MVFKIDFGFTPMKKFKLFFSRNWLLHNLSRCHSFTLFSYFSFSSLPHGLPRSRVLLLNKEESLASLALFLLHSAPELPSYTRTQQHKETFHVTGSMLLQNILVENNYVVFLLCFSFPVRSFYRKIHI